ncbi:Cysteine-rich RLK (receptor-like protein kinase) 8 [Cucumis melo var. makuwa]|uniref:Cysteine-rich RLK (Receptor-like protein kinase) 8 n=1 Tax=Cucumis melo var. makuwa TaxID=1194695 RepID=A0A5A7UN21_CUCMM|nr:Cysteine-rich RLK (receptor-like protein kinase) 8 [Cucumis melo var. makuwa]
MTGLMLLFLKMWKKKNRDDDEIEVRTETSNNEAEQGHIGKLDEYDPSLDIPIALRKGTRFCIKHPIYNYVSYDSLSPQFRAFTANLDSTIISKNIYTALESPKWKNAVMEEMKAPEKNRTWEHKARLVAKGFTLTYGIDYSETFSPVAKLNTVRVLLSVTVNKDWPLYKLDVKNVVFEWRPCGGNSLPLSSPKGTARGFDHTLFTKVSKTVKIVILIVYVDDIVLTGDDQTEISQLKQRMGDEFEIKDLGNLKYFLGMKVVWSKEGISVSQRKYTLDLLTETSMLGCRPADTPIEFNYKLGNSDDQVPVDKKNISVFQFMQSTYEKHMESVNIILRYLKNTPEILPKYSAGSEGSKKVSFHCPLNSLFTHDMRIWRQCFMILLLTMIESFWVDLKSLVGVYEDNRLLYPTALTFIQNHCFGNGSSVLAVTEGCQLTIWDLRMKENGGCLQRICGSVGDNFYAVCTSSNGNIAVGGADRTITTYDPRRWSALSRWVHCSKYEVLELALACLYLL